MSVTVVEQSQVQLPDWVSFSKFEQVVLDAGFSFSDWDEKNVPCIGCASCAISHPAYVRQIIGTSSHIAYLQKGKIQIDLDAKLAHYFGQTSRVQVSIPKSTSGKYFLMPHESQGRIQTEPDLLLNDSYFTMR